MDENKLRPVLNEYFVAIDRFKEELAAIDQRHNTYAEIHITDVDMSREDEYYRMRRVIQLGKIVLQEPTGS